MAIGIRLKDLARKELLIYKPAHVLDGDLSSLW